MKRSSYSSIILIAALGVAVASCGVGAGGLFTPSASNVFTQNSWVSESGYPFTLTVTQVDEILGGGYNVTATDPNDYVFQSFNCLLQSATVLNCTPATGGPSFGTLTYTNKMVTLVDVTPGESSTHYYVESSTQ